MSPRHASPRDEKRTAVAPYNFVPLPERILAAPAPLPQNIYEGLSGRFECELETCSPTFIRGMMPEADYAAGKESKDKPDAFSIDGKTPVLPGSSLRGMLRTLVEVVSFSRMSAITGERLVYRAVGDTTAHGRKYRERIMREEEKNSYVPLMRGGYIRKWHEDWYIQPAEEIGGTTFARIPIDKIPKDLERWHESNNASRIYIEPGPFEYQDVRGGFLKIKYSKTLRASSRDDPDLRPAALVQSGKMLKKNSEAIIFAPDPAKAKRTDWLAIDPALAHAYRDQITDEQIALLGDKRGPKEPPDRNGVLRDYQPVFYLCEDGKVVFFGHTMMLRLTYRHSPADLIPKELENPERTDLAEALFGYAGKKTAERARAGRVLFSDAVCAAGQENVFEREITPEVLAAPKPTTFQHYLEQPDPDDKTHLRDYDDDTRPRGHKFYWHKDKRDLKEIEETDPKKLAHKTQYTRIRPLRPGVRFAFSIHFENLSAIELGALAWVLQVGSDPAYRLKLGMGKPLGMGAVKLTSSLHLDRRLDRYARLWNEKGEWQSGERPAAEAETERREAVQAFEKWVLGDFEINPGKLASLAQLRRIQSLLRMLAWPGPNADLTRYMEIEHPDPQAKRGKRNEYRERPVLPDPLDVGKTPGPRQAPKQSQESSRVQTPDRRERQAPPPGPRRPRPPGGRDEAAKLPEPVEEPPTPAPKKQPQYGIGVVFTGKVSRVYDDGSVAVTMPGLDLSRGYAIMRVSELGDKKLGMGFAARCEIVKILQDTGGRTMYECKPAPKRK